MFHLVTWEIELEADTPLMAARLALNVQRDLGSLATSFTVGGQTIDLAEEEEDADWNVKTEMI